MAVCIFAHVCCAVIKRLSIFLKIGFGKIFVIVLLWFLFKLETYDFYAMLLVTWVNVAIVFLINFIFIRFNENIMIDPGSLDIFPASRIPKHMHHCFKPIYQPIHKMTKGELKVEDIKKEKGFRVRTDPSMLSSLLQFVSDAEVAPSFLMNCIYFPIDSSYFFSLQIANNLIITLKI